MFNTYLIVMILSPWHLLCFSTSMCAPVATRMAFMLLPPLPITRLIAFGGTDTFLERNGEFINLPESSDCPLKKYDACIKEYMFIYENKYVHL